MSKKRKRPWCDKRATQHHSYPADDVYYHQNSRHYDSYSDRRWTEDYSENYDYQMPPSRDQHYQMPPPRDQRGAYGRGSGQYVPDHGSYSRQATSPPNRYSNQPHSNRPSDSRPADSRPTDSRPRDPRDLGRPRHNVASSSSSGARAYSSSSAATCDDALSDKLSSQTRMIINNVLSGASQATTTISQTSNEWPSKGPSFQTRGPPENQQTREPARNRSQSAGSSQDNASRPSPVAGSNRSDDGIQLGNVMTKVERDVKFNASSGSGRESSSATTTSASASSSSGANKATESRSAAVERDSKERLLERANEAMLASAVQHDKPPAPSIGGASHAPTVSAAGTKTDILKLTMTAPRSRRDQLEIERVLHEHAARVATKKTIAVAQRGGRAAESSSMTAAAGFSLDFASLDAVAPAIQEELEREIGMPLSGLQSPPVAVESNAAGISERRNSPQISSSAVGKSSAVAKNSSSKTPKKSHSSNPKDAGVNKPPPAKKAKSSSSTAAKDSQAGNKKEKAANKTTATPKQRKQNTSGVKSKNGDSAVKTAAKRTPKTPSNDLRKTVLKKANNYKATQSVKKQPAATKLAIPLNQELTGRPGMFLDQRGFYPNFAAGIVPQVGGSQGAGDGLERLNPDVLSQQSLLGDYDMLGLPSYRAELDTRVWVPLGSAGPPTPTEPPSGTERSLFPASDLQHGGRRGSAGNRESLSTILEISMAEENIRAELHKSGMEIERLRTVMLRTKQALHRRLQQRAMLSAEEERLRQTRLRLLRALSDAAQSSDRSSGTRNAPSDENSRLKDPTENSYEPRNDEYSNFTGTDEAAAAESNYNSANDIQPFVIMPLSSDESNDSNPAPENNNSRHSEMSSTSSLPVEPSQVLNAGAPASSMHVVYCGTLSADRLLEPGVLNGLAQNLVSNFGSPPPAPVTCTPADQGATSAPFLTTGDEADSRDRNDSTVDSITIESDDENLMDDSVNDYVVDVDPLSAQNTPCAVRSAPATPTVQTPRTHSMPAASEFSLSVPQTAKKSGTGRRPQRRPRSLDNERLSDESSEVGSIDSRHSRAMSSASPSSAVQCIAMLPDAVMYACSDGRLHRQMLKNGSSDTADVPDDGEQYLCHEGGVLCLLATRAGPNRQMMLFSIGVDKSMSLVGYPFDPAVPKTTMAGSFDCYASNCIAECNGIIYVGLRNGRIACVTSKTLARKPNDIACGYSNVCALTTVRVATQRLLCFSVHDSNEILVRDAATAKPYGKSLVGLPSTAKFLQGLQQYVISSAGNTEVYVHSLQTCSMEKTFSINSTVVGLATKARDKQVIIADSCGCLTWIGIKDGVRYITYTRQEITAIASNGELVCYGTSDGEVFHTPVSRSCYWNCRYVHCQFKFWRACDLKRHVLNDHLDQMRSLAGDPNVMVCKWDACLEVISADIKSLRRHFLQHISAELSVTVKPPRERD